MVITGGNITTAGGGNAAIFNTNTGSLSLGGAASSVSVGSSSNTTSVNGQLSVAGTGTFASNAFNLSGTAPVIDATGGSATLGINTTTNRPLTLGSGTLQINTNTINLAGNAPAIAASTAATNLQLNAGTSGKVQIANSSTGDIELGGGSSSTGCTITNSSGAIACSGAFTTTGNSGTIQFGYFTKDFNTGIISNSTGSDTLAVTTSSANTSALALNSTAVTTSSTAGLNNTFTISGSGSSSTYYGQKLTVNNNQTVNADTAYGQYISFADNVSSGLANTLTGLYVDASTTNANDLTYAAAFMNGNVGIGTAAPGGTLSVVGNTATATATSSSFNLTNAALTTGTLAYLNSTSVTTGRLLDITTGSSSTWTGNGTSNGLVNIASSSTGGANNNILFNLNRSGANTTSSVTSYGLYSSITNSGTSSTNVASYLSATGGTNNYGLIVANGSVGIGTSSPASLFSIGSSSQFQVDSSGNLITTGSGSFGGNLYVGTAGTSNGTITLQSSGSSISGPTLTTDSTGNVTLQTNQVNKTTTIGSGSGAINLIANGANNIFVSLGQSGATGSLVVQNNGTTVDTITTSGALALGTASAPQRTLDVTGSFGGNTVVDTQTQNSGASVTEATAALMYHLTNNFGTSAAGNVTFNITGLPAVDGTFAVVYTNATNGATTNSHNLIVQVAGTQVGSTNIASSGGTTIKAYIVSRTNGAWHAVSVGPSNSNTADLAEWIDYTGTQPIPGELLTNAGSVNVARTSSQSYDQKILGIRTTNPNTVYGQDDGTSVPMTLAGRVPTIVTSISGNISAGDQIVTSELSGVGMVAKRASQTVGKALEDFNTTSCTTASSYDTIPWPDDDGTNSAHPCFALPVSSFDSTTQSELAADYGLTSTDTVYVGKIMVQVTPSFIDPSNALAQLSYDGVSLLTANGNLSVTGGISSGTGAFGSTGQLSIDSTGNLGTSGSVTASTLGISAGTVTSGSGSFISQLASDTDSGNPTAFVFKSASGTGLFSVDSNGNATLAGTITTSKGNYDLAEDYPSTDPTIAKGDIVAIDTTNSGHVVKSNGAYDSKILGIYSDKPGFRLSQSSFGQGDVAVPVALTGRVPVKVSLENGPIHKGDYLTSSSVAGVAMKATKAGQVIGKALEDYNLNSSGKVMAFVNVGYADPSNTLANLTIDDSGNLLTSSIKTTSLQLSGVDSTKLAALQSSLDPSALQTVGNAVNSGSDSSHVDLAATINTILTAQKSTEDKLAALQDQTASLSSQIAGVASQSAQLASQLASQSSTLASTSAHLTSQDEALASASASIASISAQLAAGTFNPHVTDPSTLFASGSASVSKLNVADTLSSLNLSTIDATVSGELNVLGNTTLGSTAVNGDFNVNGTFSVSPTADGNAINSLTTLYLQNSPLAELVDIFNGGVKIAKDGSITTAGDINVGGNLNLAGGVTIDATAGEDLNAGDALYISGDGVVKKADSSDPDTLTVMGVATKDALKDSKVAVIISGKAKGFKNLIAGKKYYLGSQGALSDTVPLNAVRPIVVGVAFSQAEILIQPSGN